MLSRAMKDNNRFAVTCTSMVAAGILSALPGHMFEEAGGTAPQRGGPDTDAAVTASPAKGQGMASPGGTARARRGGGADAEGAAGGPASTDHGSDRPSAFESTVGGSDADLEDCIAGTVGVDCEDIRQDSFSSFGSRAAVDRANSSGTAAGPALTPANAQRDKPTGTGVQQPVHNTPLGDGGGIGAAATLGSGLTPDYVGVGSPQSPTERSMTDPMDLAAIADAALKSHEAADDSDSDIDLPGRSAVVALDVPEHASPGTSDSPGSSVGRSPGGADATSPPPRGFEGPLSPTHKRKATLLSTMSPPISIATHEISALLGSLAGLGDSDDDSGSTTTAPVDAGSDPCAAKSTSDGVSAGADSPTAGLAAAEGGDEGEQTQALTPKEATARANVLNEIIASEKSYIASLKGLVSVFMEPLAATPQPSMQYVLDKPSKPSDAQGHTAKRQAASRNLFGGGEGGLDETPQQQAARSLLTHIEHAQLFGGVNTLVPLHEHLLSQLKEAVAKAYAASAAPPSSGVASPPQGKPSNLVTPAVAASVCFGDIFLKLSNFFKMYSSYVANHASANELLVHLQDTNRGLKEHIQAAQQQPGARGQPLQSLLIMPVQRVPRYELLLTTLLKHTPSHLPDHSDVEQALQRVKTAARAINTNITLFLTQRAVLQIQRCLIPEPDPSLVTPSRRFVREGALKKLTKGSTRPYTVFLFTDKLVYGSSATGISGTISSLFNRGRRSSVGTPVSSKRGGALTPLSSQPVSRTAARQLVSAASSEEQPSSAPGRSLRTFSSEASAPSASSGGEAADSGEMPSGGMVHAHSTGEIGLARGATHPASPPPFAASAANSQSALMALTAAVTADSDKPREKVSLHNIIDFTAVESLPDTDKTQHAFLVQGTPKSITLVAPDAETKAEWIQSIRSCILEMHLAGGK